MTAFVKTNNMGYINLEEKDFNEIIKEAEFIGDEVIKITGKGIILLFEKFEESIVKKYNLKKSE